MKWLTRIALVVGVLVAILAIAPFFITLNDYIPVVEEEISARLEEPVSIDSLHASAFPVPHVRIEGIAIGAADEIKVGKLTFTPDLWSLLASQKTIRSVEVDDLALSQKALGALIALTQRDSSSTGIRVEKIRLNGAVLKLERSAFGPFDAQVRVSTGELPGSVTLATRDGALNAKVTPDGERYLLDLSARNWTPPLGPAIRFDELEVKGVATHKDVDLNDLNAKLYGGTLAGKAVVAWEKGIAVKGALDVHQVELNQLAALVSPKTRVSGRLTAKPVFSTHAAKAAQLDEALRVETQFDVRNGVLHGFDIVNAATSLVKQGSGGGQTRFEELSGHLMMERGAYRFTQLKIASGTLAARGNVNVSSGKALSGQLHANVKALGRTAAVPLTVAGTLDSPMLYPNPAALAGAAAGTAILGPGVGTAAGARLGEFAEGLFGKKKP